MGLIGASWLVVLLVSFVFGEELPTDQCYDSNGMAIRCEPLTDSFSFNRRPIANSTCGIPPSSFCSRQIDVIFGTVTSDCTGVCNASDPANSHSAELMTDFLLVEESWWQSENSLDTQNIVVIDLAFQTLIEVQVITFDFVSFKPNSFYLLKSNDFGQTYTPYHYFATSCTEAFGLDSDLTLDFTNETIALCQSINTPPVPGPISFFPRLNRPSTNDSVPGFSSMLLDFLTATNIQVVLVEHYPILDLAPDDLGYYYAIQDLNVVGSCQCNGHASSCSRNLQNGQYECDCKHNTTGQFCERCADFYQDRPWRRANGHGEFECIACNCNNHSTECVFDADVYRESGETSGGVCVNCEHNTMGRQCENCASLYYQVPGLVISHPDACQACNCHLAGITNDGECNQVATEISDVGQCFCKSQVIGRMCDQCIPGFFNLSSEHPEGCQECGCSDIGAVSSVCNSDSGVCECKPNIAGDKCSRCLPDYYQPNPSSAEGCLPCNCNPGGSTSSQCDLQTGQCACREGVQGRTCFETIPGNFFPSVDYIQVEAEDVSSNPVIEQSGENERFTGTGFARIVNATDILDFGILTVPVSGEYEALLRYTLQGVTVWESATLTITSVPPDLGGSSSDQEVVYTSWSMGIGLSKSLPVNLEGGRMYRFILHNFISGVSTSSARLYIDSFCLVPVSIPSLVVFSDSQLVSDYMECLGQYRRVITQSSASPSCASTIFTISTAIYNGTLECSCDPTGSQPGTDCEAFGGQCVCLPGVRGSRCDQCTPGFYNLTSTGCSGCSCNEIGSLSTICDPITGQCECLNNVIGRDCSLCDEGFRDVTDLQCISCQCDPVGSMSAQCDDDTGVCECKPGVVGTTCDQCADLYYDFQDTGCRSCDCDQAGSTNASCNQMTGQCSCVENVIGRDCSTCQMGTFNLNEDNPSGCQACFCFGLTSQCSSANGFVRSSISTIFNSSADNPLNGWLLIADNSSETIMNQGADIMTNGIVFKSNFDGSLQAPQQFLGNRLSSYSQYLQVRLAPVINNSIVMPLSPYHVIIASDSVQLGANITKLSDGLYSVQLHEMAGWVNLNSLTPVSSYELQQTLASLRSLLVSIHFNVNVTLAQISLDSTALSSDMIGEPVGWVEHCECPLGYAGLSCEICAQGYTRTASNTCELCQCNGFTSDCDPETGVCLNCTQSTTGSSCQLCESGTFGDPVRGVTCRPCPCPLTQEEGGRFSDECILQSNGEAVCTNCLPGHTGQKCEACVTGYFGDPTGNLTGQPTTCTDCLCSGNINQSDPFSCDPMTGLCTRCLRNTAGQSCERCADGFYGDAVTAKNCTECSCDASGSESEVCDTTSGQCTCFPNIVGLSCDRCAPEHYGFGRQTGSGCLPCNCNTTGSMNVQCDDNGQCACLSGVTGANCDQCLEGYFDFSSNGCQECSCSPVNSPSTVCEVDGTCICLPGSTGVDCRQCSQNFFLSTEGCTECPSCYQQIENEALEAEVRFTTAHNRLTMLQAMLSDSSLTQYEPRTMMKQRLVDNIVMIINALNMREANLTARHDAFVTVVMEALNIQNTQIQFYLDSLKSSATTVIVLAATSNELVDRIISEFFAASDFLDIIRNDLLPGILISSQRIESSLTSAHTDSLALSQTLSTVAAQVADIQSHIMLLTMMLANTRDDISSVSNFFTNISALIEDLQETRDLAIVKVDSVAQVRKDLASAIQVLEKRIFVLPNLPNPPAEGPIRTLISLSSMLESDINTDILSEIFSQQQKLSTLSQTLQAEMERLDVLQMQLEGMQTRVDSQSVRSQTLQNEVYTIVESVNQRINLAEIILQHLEQFSNNSLQVSVQANITLQSVTSINEQATLAQIEAQNLLQRIASSHDQVNTTKEITSEASAIISQTEQEVLAFNSSLLATESRNVERSTSASALVRESSIEVMGIHESLNADLSSIEDFQMTVDEIEVNATQVLLEDAQAAVRSLQDRLRRITSLDDSSLSSIETLLSDVTAELSVANIDSLSSLLREKIVEQRSYREDLEASVNQMQQQINYLSQIQASLPADCSS